MKKRNDFSRASLLFATLLTLLAGLSAPVRAAPGMINSALDVVISEVAWGGTAASSADEWLELYNPTNTPVNLSGWSLSADDGAPIIALTGSIPANGYYLLESGDDTTISNIKADQTYSGSLSNDGEILRLMDNAPTPVLIDTANGDGGGWNAGTASSTYYSMERNLSVLTPESWTDGTLTALGRDASGNPLRGTPHNSQIDLSLEMTVSNPTPAVGAVIDFTVTVTNHGTYDATHVSVMDAFPTAGMNSPTVTPSLGTYSSASGVWDIGTLPFNTSATLKFSTQLTAAGVKTNRAEIWSADQFDPDSTPANGVSTEDDLALAKAVTPDATALNISNSVNNPSPSVGTNIIFTIKVDNPSSNAYIATNVYVSAKLPDGLNYVSYSSTSGTYDGISGIWTVGTLNKNTGAMLNITAKVVSSSLAPYKATANSDEYIPSDDSVTITGSLSGEADLSLTQASFTPATTAGNAILTITVTNNGPDNATGVDVKDLLPAGLTYVSSAPPAGTTYSKIGRASCRERV